MTTWFPTAVADFLSFLLCHDKICFAAKLIPLCKPFSPISDVFASHIANLCIFFAFWCRGSSAFLSNSRFTAFDYDIKMLKREMFSFAVCRFLVWLVWFFCVCFSAFWFSSLKLLLLISYPCHPLQSTPRLLSHCQNSCFLSVPPYYKH